MYRLFGNWLATKSKQTAKKSENIIFGNWLQTGHCRAHRSAEDGLLGNWRVADATRSKLLQKADGRLKDAPSRGDVLAEKYNVGIPFHFLGDPARHRIAISQFRHAQPPSL
jgi:hypothetical protein